jgi:signal transduction histidine kinase
MHMESSPLTSGQLEKQLEQTQALFKISQMLAGTIDLQTTLQQIADAATALIKKAERTTLHILDESESSLEPVAVSGVEEPKKRIKLKFKPGEGIAGLVLAYGKTILVSDVLTDPRYIPIKGGENTTRSLLVAPVRTDQVNLGTLSVQSVVPGVFTDDDENLLTILGLQAAVAIEKARIIRTEHEQRVLAEVLSEISIQLNKTLDFDHVLDLLVIQIDRLVPFDKINILLVNKSQLSIVRSQEKSRAIDKYETNPIDISHIPEFSEIIETGRLLSLQNVSNDLASLNIIGGVKPRSWIGIPVIAYDQVIAIFSISKFEPDYYTHEHTRRLVALANQAALALQNAKLFATLQKRLLEVNTLYRISQDITGTLDLDQMLGQVVRLLKEQFGYYDVQVFLVDPETGDLIRFQNGEVDEIDHKSGARRFRPGSGIVGGVAKSLQYSLVRDLTFSSDNFRDPQLPKTYDELAIPLKTGNHFLGVLDIRYGSHDSFSEPDVQLMATVADQIAVAIEKTQIYADLQASLQHEKAVRAQLVQSEKLAALGRIVASVAHELNNPLQAIQNALYLVKMEESLSPQAQEDMRTMLAETERMTSLIARLREIYRPVVNEDFKLGTVNELVLEVQTLLNTHLRHKKIVFEFLPDENLPSIPMIRDQMKQVILNISLNAVEAMPDGGKLSVRTAHYLKSGEVFLQISDTGTSINPHILPYIFDPFVTTKEGGTGLGLAITYDIIQRHNGRIEAESQAGKGTTINIWLPVRRRVERRVKLAEGNR